MYVLTINLDGLMKVIVSVYIIGLCNNAKKYNKNIFLEITLTIILLILSII